jgi:alpha-1,6-mannosyltransferase
MTRKTGLDWQLLALGGILMALTLWGAFTVDHLDDERVGYVMLMQAPFYALAAWLVVARSPQEQSRALWAILAVALVMRVLLLPGTPVSTDIFRYIWDGRVQGAGINPYLYIPASDALLHLRDAAIYPEINRADYAPTIYPPTTQIVFFLVTRISESIVFMKVVMVGFEALTVWAILQLLKARGLPATHVLLYAWHPLPLWEFARSGHIDAVAIAFLMLAFLAAGRRSPVLAGVALGAGTLVKYFPVVAGPSLYQRWDWRLPAAFAATIALLYLPYLGAGTKVFGFLGQYVSEERLDQGSGIFLWLLLGSFMSLPANAFPYYVPVAVAIILALAFALIMRERKPAADLWGGMVLAVTFLVLFSPHYAWYFTWLVPFLCFYPSAAIVYLTCAVGWLYVSGHWQPQLSDGLLIYGGFFLTLAAELLLRRYRRKEARHVGAVAA